MRSTCITSWVGATCGRPCGGWHAASLDIRALFPNSGCRMGKHDNRRSKKMRQRVSQKKYKARIKKQKAERQAARGTPAKAPRKPRSAAPAPAKE